MRFNVSQLLREHTGAVRQYDVSEDITGLDPDIRPLEPLTGHVTLMRDVDGILATGHLETVVQMECSRCLAPVVTSVETDLEEDFVPTVDVVTGQHVPLPEDADPATLIDEHHILDLTEVVRQDLVLALPVRPLCREDCLGICPVCGQNRNENPCECVVDEADPRWAALEELKDLKE